MKKILFIIFTFFITIGYSQSTEEFNYEKLSDPNSKNELSKYFKKTVSKRLLKKASLQSKKRNAILTFNINNENKVSNIRILNLWDAKLRDAIENAFEKYPLEKLGIEKINTKKKYSLQIISKKRSRKIFNCSSKIIVQSPSICNNCDDLDFYQDISKCLMMDVRKYFYNTFDFSISNQIQDNEDIDLFIQFRVSKDGKLINKKTKVPSIFEREVNRVLESYNQIKSFGNLNGSEPLQEYNFSISFKKGEKPSLKEINTDLISYTKPDETNSLSLFFSKNLNEEFIKKANLNRINRSLNISFEIDNKNKPFNISINSRSKDLDKKITSIFKEYPLNKLKFEDKSPFNRYTLQVLSYKEEKSVVEVSSIAGYMKIPVFKGCEKSTNISSVKKCFSKGVQTHFTKKFDADLPKKLGFKKGRLKVFISFKINNKGKIIDIKTKLSQPSKALELEIFRVVNSIPKMSIPPSRNGESFNIKYSIPFTIIVE